MSIQYIQGEVFLLRELLSDAHSQIRELQVQIERLSAALVARSLTDRRSAVEPHVERRVGPERRSESAWTFQANPNLYNVVGFRGAPSDPGRDA